MIEVPYTEISPDALRSMVEHFVLREGTDYGHHEYSLTDKVQQVLEQLKRGKAKILFDENDSTFDIVGATSG